MVKPDRRRSIEPEMEENHIVIREAKPSDAAILVRLIESLAQIGGVTEKLETGKLQIKRAMSGKHPRFAAYLAIMEGNIVGYATYTIAYSIWSGECYISVDDVFVSPTHRDTDAGQRLITAIAKLCAQQNCQARWELPSGSSETRSYYEKLGVVSTEKCVCTWGKTAINQSWRRTRLINFHCASDYHLV